MPISKVMFTHICKDWMWSTFDWWSAFEVGTFPLTANVQTVQMLAGTSCQCTHQPHVWGVCFSRVCVAVHTLTYLKRHHSFIFFQTLVLIRLVSCVFITWRYKVLRYCRCNFTPVISNIDMSLPQAVLPRANLEVFVFPHIFALILYAVLHL